MVFARRSVFILVQTLRENAELEIKKQLLYIELGLCTEVVAHIV